MYKFYIKLDGDTFGPYSAKEMLNLDLLPDTMVTEESLNGTWYPASRMDFQDMYLKESGTVINEDGTIQRADISLPHSSSRNSSVSNNANPSDLSKFNWGAFMFTWLWGVFNGVYWPIVILLVNLIPGIGQIAAFGMAIYLGISGNKLAWESGKQWPSFDSFMETQRNWGKAVLWLIVIIAVIVLLGVISSM